MIDRSAVEPNFIKTLMAPRIWGMWLFTTFLFVITGAITGRWADAAFVGAMLMWMCPMYFYALDCIDARGRDGDTTE